MQLNAIYKKEAIKFFKMHQRDIFSCFKFFLIAGPLPLLVLLSRQMLMPYLQLLKSLGLNR